MKSKIDKDLRTLEAFIRVYCLHHHKNGKKGEPFCPDCQELFEYARQRRQICPHETKPACKNCETHCYRPEYRQRIREIMRFSGIYFVKRGRLDWLLHYFLS